MIGAVSKLSAVDYDIMDVGAKHFDEDYYRFRQRVKELERQLGSVLTQAFDDCNTNIACFKLFDTFAEMQKGLDDFLIREIWFSACIEIGSVNVGLLVIKARSFQNGLPETCLCSLNHFQCTYLCAHIFGISGSLNWPN